MQNRKWLLDYANLRQDEERARECLCDEEKQKWSRLLMIRREARIEIGHPVSEMSRANSSMSTSSSTPLGTSDSLRSGTVRPTAHGTTPTQTQPQVQSPPTPSQPQQPPPQQQQPQPPPPPQQQSSAHSSFDPPPPAPPKTMITNVGGGAASGVDKMGSPTVRSAAGGRFHVSRSEKNVLGRGSFGVVYKGFDNLTGLTVAVKETKLDSGNRASIRQALESEFKMLTTLDHPCIVKVFALSTINDDTAQIVMEWMPSGSVHDLVWRTGFRVHEGVIHRFMRHALSGLAYLHAKGILHRDIKPANMLVSGSGEVKLSDFGTCKQTLSQGQGSTTASMVGTPYYLAPEAIAEGRYSVGSDVWAMACSAVEMATCRFPWYHLPPQLHQPVQLMFYIGNIAGRSDHHPLIPDHLSSALRALLARCFDKDANARPTAEELLKDPYFASFDLPDDAESMADFSDIAALNRQSSSAFWDSDGGTYASMEVVTSQGATSSSLC